MWSSTVEFHKFNFHSWTSTIYNFGQRCCNIYVENTVFNPVKNSLGAKTFLAYLICLYIPLEAEYSLHSVLHVFTRSFFFFCFFLTNSTVKKQKNHARTCSYQKCALLSVILPNATKYATKYGLKQFYKAKQNKLIRDKGYNNYYKDGCGLREFANQIIKEIKIAIKNDSGWTVCFLPL